MSINIIYVRDTVRTLVIFIERPANKQQSNFLNSNVYSIEFKNINNHTTIIVVLKVIKNVWLHFFAEEISKKSHHQQNLQQSSA